MKKQIKRWYEKNESLSAFMNLFATLNLDEQAEIAIDIIMQASEMTNRDYDKIIQEISEFDPKDFKRWYDKNPSIHVAIETLRDLSDEQKEEIVHEFTERIIGDKYSELDGEPEE